MCLCCPFKLFEPDYQFWRNFVRKLCNINTQMRMYQSSAPNKTNMRTKEIVRRNRKGHSFLQYSQMTFGVIKLVVKELFLLDYKTPTWQQSEIYVFFFCLMLKTNKPVEPGVLNSLQKHVIDTRTRCK